MSDPLKSADIEDVLSSIRRLVSDDSRLRPSPAVAAVDRLVLTPALRVSEADVPSGPVAAVVQGVSVSDDGGQPRDDAQPGEFPAGAEAAPDVADAAATQPEQDRAAAPEDSMTEAPHVTQADLPDAGQQGDPTPEAPLVLDAWTQDGTGADAAGAGGDDVLEWEDHMDDDIADDAALAADAPADVAAQDAAAAPQPQPADPQAEPHRAPEPSDAYSDEAPVDLTADDTLLDEETLRELVAEIVRQELQGALGERITRNVRKLVRREIHRALSSQDFE